MIMKCFKTILQRFAVVAGMTLLVVLIVAPAQAQMMHTSAEQAIMLDYDTGMVLFEKNADEKMAPSSMSKVMTMYLVFEALKNGQLRLDTTFPVSEKAWRKGGSKMFVEVGKRVAVEDLIRGVVVQSGNDATIVLAEGVAGSEETFAEWLNESAEQIGMDNSHFVNASGWPEEDHYSTARDLATLAKHLISDFPDYYDYFAETEFTYNNIRQRNRNPLLYRDMNIDGIKTGHTEDGGYGLMASGTRDGRRVILVVNGLDNEKERAQESARLMEWGLKGFENVTIFEKGETVTDARAVMGRDSQVPLVIHEDLTVTVPSTLKNDLKVTASYDGPLEAPVKEGMEAGTLTVDIPRITKMELPLYAGADVKRLGLISGTLAKLELFLQGKAAGEF